MSDLFVILISTALMVIAYSAGHARGVHSVINQMRRLPLDTQEKVLTALNDLDAS